MPVRYLIFVYIQEKKANVLTFLNIVEMFL